MNCLPPGACGKAHFGCLARKATSLANCGVAAIEGWLRVHAYFDQLAAWRPTARDQLVMMPVFSNVGEPDEVDPTSRRPNHMAVFGRPGTELGIYYGQDSEKSKVIAQKLGVEKVIDIGLREWSIPATLGNVAVVAPFRTTAASFSK